MSAALRIALIIAVLADLVHIRPMQQRILPQVLPSLVAMTLLSLSWAGGLGYTSDSLLYLQGAAHLSDYGYEGLFTTLAFRAKPPGFSTLLWLSGRIPAVLMLLQTLLLGMTVHLASRQVGTFWSTTTWQWWARCLLAVATPLVLVHHFLWTEGVFLLLLLSYWLLLMRIEQAADSRKGLVFLLLLCGLALVSIKHIAMVFVVAGSLWLLVRRSWWLAAVQGLVPLLAFVLWQLALSKAAPTMGRMDYISGVQLWSNLSTYATGICDWLFPLSERLAPLNVLVALTLLFLISYAGLQSKVRRQSSSGLLAISILLYGAAMLPKGILEPGDIERYLSLIFIPMVLLAGHYEYLLQRLSPKGAQLAQLLAWGWLLYPLLRTSQNVAFWAGWL